MNERLLNYNNVRYGMLVEVLTDSGYHDGCKVHFYNRKGVLVGNYYEFMPYERLMLRDNQSRYYPRFYTKGPFAPAKNKVLIMLCWCVDLLIRFIEPIMD